MIDGDPNQIDPREQYATWVAPDSNPIAVKPEAPKNLSGFGEGASFDNFLALRSDKEQGIVVNRLKLKPELGVKATEILSKIGLEGRLSLDSLPQRFFDNLDLIQDPDLEFIKQSPEKLLALRTVVNFYTNEKLNRHSVEVNHFSQLPGERFFSDYVDTTQPTPEEVGGLAGLPLVYGTNYETLNKILGSGGVLSDRANFEEQTANNAEAMHSYQTNTTREDRQVGLDNYVFTYFGRPHTKRSYGSVQILFKPDRIHTDPKSFATENDYLDEDIMLAEDGASDYKDQVTQGDYFLKSAARSLKRKVQPGGLGQREHVIGKFLAGETDVKDQFGGVHFSTWEVKTSELRVEDIDGIVFTSAVDLNKFKETQGDRFRLIFRPQRKDLAAALIEVTGGVAKSFADRADLSDTELVEAAKNLFPDIMQKLNQHFGAEVKLDSSEIYRLSDADARANTTAIKFSESGWEKRFKALDNAGPGDLTDFFVVVYPSSIGASEKSDLNLLYPQQLFTSSADAQDWVIRQQRSADRRGSSGFGGGTERKILNFTLAKVTTLKTDWLDYEKNRGNDVQSIKNYKIKEFVELKAA